MRKLCAAAAAICLAAGITGVQAADERGHLSLYGGMYSNDSTDDGSGDYAFGGADTSFGFDIANGVRWDMDLMFEAYDYNSADNQFEQPEYTGLIGGHLGFTPYNGVYWGLLIGYAYSWLHDEDNYSMWMIGPEAQTMVNDTRLFGQAGYGDAIQTDGEEEGFQSGWFVRVGGEHYLSDNTFIGAEGTYAEASPYIDGSCTGSGCNDNGEFYGMTLRAETRIPNTDVNAGLYFSYNYYDSTTENDTIDERIFGVRFTYRFNNTSARAAAQAGASVGLPLVPIYANGWAEQID